MTPRLLDLFCGAGGAAMGYHWAGFDVVGVDIEPQPHYPFTFFQADALEWVNGWTGQFPPLNGFFDAIHASPPCQAYTSVSNRWRGTGGRADSHRNLLAPTLALVKNTGLPWIVENVPGARREMPNPIVLSGGMFGLGVQRPRLFSSSFPIGPLKAVPVRNSIGVYGKPDGRRLYSRKDGTTQYAASSLEEAQRAMGMDWADWHGTKEAIPPAYTRYIGAQLLQYLKVAA